MAIKGTVAAVYEKDWDGQDGKIVLHSFQLQGDKRYFRTGTNRLVSKGESVSFEVEGNNSVVESTLSKTEAAVRTAPAPTGGGRPAWGGRGGGSPKSTENFEARQKYWESKEQRDVEVVEPRITWSSSRTAAIEVIKAALAHDALAFGNASKGAKLGMILDYVDEVTARFYAQSMNVAQTVAELSPGTEVSEAAGSAEVDND